MGKGGHRTDIYITRLEAEGSEEKKFPVVILQQVVGEPEKNDAAKIAKNHLTQWPRLLWRCTADTRKEKDNVGRSVQAI